MAASYNLIENTPEENYQRVCNFSAIMSDTGMLIGSSVVTVICTMMISIYVVIFWKISQTVNLNLNSLCNHESYFQLLLQKKLALSSSDQNYASSRDVRLAKTFSLIIGTYIILWAPLITCFFISAYKQDASYFYSHWSLKIFVVFAMCTSHFNAAVNPFIYAFQIREVRDTVKKIFKVNHESDGLESRTTGTTGTSRIHETFTKLSPCNLLSK